MMENAYIHCLNLTSVWWRWRRRRLACVIEGRRWRRRSACSRGRVTAAVEETGSSSVDGGGVESGSDLESFAMKSETPWDGLLFIVSKLSAAVLN
jgi:hypothetical protein